MHMNVCYRDKVRVMSESLMEAIESFTNEGHGNAVSNVTGTWLSQRTGTEVKGIHIKLLLNSKIPLALVCISGPIG